MGGSERTGLSVNLMQLAIVAPDQTQPAESARKYQRSAGISNFIERTAERANELPSRWNAWRNHGMGWDG
jgi:hypothetical protein